MKRTFPYAYARVSAMKAKLIARGEYHKLLKMDLSSITRFLQESEYKEEITKLGTQFSGLELVDRALRENQGKIYQKLRRICPSDVEDVINLFLDRVDFQNLKVILRGIYSNAKSEDVMDLIDPVCRFPKEHYQSLFETGSVEKAIAQSKIVTEKECVRAIELYRQESRLIELENEIDKLYYRHVIKSAENLPRHGTAFKRFILQDIDLTNIRNLMRFKNEGMDKTDIMNLMIIEGLRLDKTKLHRLTRGENLNTVLSALSKTYYGKHIEFEGDISEIELKLKIYQVKRVFHGKPLSIDTILNYMIRKLIEVRNLRSLVKSKHLNVPTDYVEKNLLVV